MRQSNEAFRDLWQLTFERAAAERDAALHEPDES